MYETTEQGSVPAPAAPSGSFAYPYMQAYPQPSPAAPSTAYVYPPMPMGSSNPYTDMSMGHVPPQTQQSQAAYSQAYLQSQFVGVTHIPASSRLMDRPPQRDENGKFVCSECSRTYNHSKHLKRHMLRHTGERPYGCDYCSAAFTRTDICKRHKQKCKFARNPQNRRPSGQSMNMQVAGGVQSMNGANYFPKGAEAYRNKQVHLPGTVTLINGQTQVASAPAAVQSQAPTPVAPSANYYAQPGVKNEKSLSPGPATGNNTPYTASQSSPALQSHQQHYSPQFTYNGAAPASGQATAQAPRSQHSPPRDAGRPVSTPPYNRPLPNTQFILGYPTPSMGNGRTPTIAASNGASPMENAYHPQMMYNGAAAASAAANGNGYGLGIYFQK